MNQLKEFLRTSIIFFLFSVCLFFGNCNAKRKVSVNKEELVKYINNKDNRVSLEQESNGIKVKISYQPFQLLVLQELDGIENRNDSAIIKKLEDKYRSQYYFKLKFSKNGKEAIRQLGDFNAYSNMVQVLSFKMGQFINLTTPQKDTLDLSDYIFDQTYGMSDGNAVLLSFDNQHLKNSEAFDVNIQELGFGTGAIKFKFKKQDIDRVPKMEYPSASN